MPPYKVHVTKGIWVDEDQTDLFDDLYYDLELPFPPFIGLGLSEAGWYCGPIERVKWDGERQMFVVESQAHTPNPRADFSQTAAEIRDRDMKTYNWLSYKTKL